MRHKEGGVNMKAQGRDEWGRVERILAEHGTNLFSLEASFVSLT